MAEQALDVGKLWGQVRAHRLLLAVVVLLGAGLGAASVWPFPPTYTSNSRVLLPPLPDSGGDPAERDGQTEVEVARSDVVLGPAGQALSPPATVSELTEQVTVAALTPNVLQIVAEAGSAARAEAIADAVARSELAYLGQTLETRSTTRAAVLAEREKSLGQSLDTVTRQIELTRARRDRAGPDAPTAASDASALAQLTAEQANLVLALDEVRGLMTSVDTATPAMAIEEASEARRPGLVTQLALRGTAGAVAALLVALLVLSAAGRRDRRLRYRDEVADALGTVVLASVRSRVPRTTAGWTDLFAGYEPGTVDAWALRQVMRQLAHGTSPASDRGTDSAAHPGIPHPRSVTVIALAGDQRGLAMGPQLASYAASLGITTRLVAAQGNDSAPLLWAACGTRVRAVEGRPALSVATRDRGKRPELTVVLAVVDPRHPELKNLPSTEVSVLAVSSAAATAEEVARVAVAADDASRRIAGVVLADPDDLDRTTGRLLHHERLHEMPLPAHLTGLGPTDRNPGNVSGIRGRG